jgi:hypothetical protein
MILLLKFSVFFIIGLVIMIIFDTDVTEWQFWAVYGPAFIPVHIALARYKENAKARSKS